MVRSYSRSVHRFLWALPIMCILAMSPQANAKGKSLMFEVTVTNITPNQIFSPPVVVSHRAGLEPIFKLGEGASSDLAAVAEDGDGSGLAATLLADPHVIEVANIMGTGPGGVILPGETASIELDAGYGYKKNLISLVGMLVTTNDAFFGVNAASASQPPRFWGNGRKEMYLSPAYDAGSEFNSELCMYIPGPPCGNPFMHDATPAEGFVHIHPGIFGVADLIAADSDWNNPVAKITVRLFRD